MRTVSLPEFAFPSLASILPFLEEASAEKPSIWIISRASSLENYFAGWIQSAATSSSDDEPSLISMVSHSGEDVSAGGSVSPTSVATKSASRKYCLLLIPREWGNQEGLSIPSKLASRIIASRPENQKAWTVQKSDLFGWNV